MIEPHAFAKQWVADWNRADLEAILAHYSETASFRSPFAQKVKGQSLVEGKDRLRAYWQEGLRRTSLRFTLREVLHSPESGSLAVIYNASIGANDYRACEIMRFDGDDLIQSSEAYYGTLLGDSELPHASA